MLLPKRDLQKCVQICLKKCDYSVYVDMNNIMLLPKRDLQKCVQICLKKCDYSIYVDMNNITLLPKRDLKTSSYEMNMNYNDNTTILPKRDLKTGSYKMNMNERDLEKLSKSELIKMLLKQKKSKKARNHEDLLDNNPFKDKVAQREPANALNQETLKQDASLKSTQIDQSLQSNPPYQD